MDVKQIVLSRYFNNCQNITVNPINHGLINNTYKITILKRHYILQKINTNVFKNPSIISNNINIINSHLRKKKIKLQLVEVIENLNAEFDTVVNGEYWRLFTFINNSVTFNSVLNSNQAYNAALAIGNFHYNLADLELEKIHDSIPNFLNFEKRLNAFDTALKNINSSRYLNAIQEIQFLNQQRHFIEKFIKINFPTRIVHGDTKISNFLFDEKIPEKVIAVIDWDTFTKGNILYDFGDMIRTYTNLVEEDEVSTKEIFSIDNYNAIKSGFLQNLKYVLSDVELNSIDLSAIVVVLIQAIRFLTDYLENDIYYSVNYKSQNLNRVKNQINLAKSIINNFGNKI